VGGQCHFALGKEILVPIVQEAGCAPGLVWMGAENLMPIGIWSTDRPSCSELLYGLHCPSNSCPGWRKIGHGR